MITTANLLDHADATAIIQEQTDGVTVSFVDFYTRLGGGSVSDTINPAADKINANIGAVIAETTDIAIGIVGEKYRATPPTIIKTAVRDIAIARCYRRQPDEFVEKRKDNALKLLEKIKSGIVSIGVTSATDSTTDTTTAGSSASVEAVTSTRYG